MNRAANVSAARAADLVPTQPGGPPDAADSAGETKKPLLSTHDGGAQARPEPAARESAGDLAEAVRQAQEGDEDAFRVLYRDIHPRILRYLRAIVGNDADDVASETWLHIARGLTAFQGDSDGFRGWTATIARNRATDHLRQHRRRAPTVAVPVDELTGLVGAEDTADLAIEGISTDAAIALIGRLPQDQAEAVLLRTVMGLDAATAAQVLGKRPGAVRTAAYRGLRKLASFLEE
ncbi:MAG TPA: RNA polymerase sigma factor [Streptosporangiaceae bacterium]|jgi:RNA polymerase sigma-70 factor (ECF subfamily)